MGLLSMGGMSAMRFLASHSGFLACLKKGCSKSFSEEGLYKECVSCPACGHQYIETCLLEGSLLMQVSIISLNVRENLLVVVSRDSVGGSLFSVIISTLRGGCLAKGA